MAAFGKIGSWTDIIKTVGTSLQLGALALLSVIALFAIAVKNAEKQSVPTMMIVGIIATVLISIVIVGLYRTSATVKARRPVGESIAPPPSTEILRPGVIEVFTEMQQHPDAIVQKLVYSAGSSDKFSLVAQLCIEKGFVPLEFRDAKDSQNPRKFVHSLIAQANLVIFDLTDGDPEIMYELGFQRGIWDAPPEAVLLFTFSDKPIPFSPFEIKKVLDDNDLREEVARALAAL